MDRKTYRCLLAVWLIAGSLYTGAFLHGLKVPEIRMLPDSHEYLAAARNLRNQGTMYAGNIENNLDFSLYTRRPPGYPFLLSALSRIHSSTSVPVIFQILLTFTGGVLLLKLMGVMGASPGSRTAGLALYLLYPSQIIYSQMIMAEIVLQFLLLLSVWFLYLYLAKKKAGFIILCNLCLAGAVLCKPVMLYFWIPSIFLHLLLFHRYSRKIILVAAMIPVLAITLWSWRNYQVTGVFHYSSLKTSHLKFKLPDASREFSSRNKQDFSKEFSRVEESAAEVLLNPENTGRFLARGIKASVAFYLDPGRFDIYRFLPLEDRNISSSVFIHWDEDWIGFFKRVPIPMLAFLGFLTVLNAMVLLTFLPFLLLRSQDMILRLFFVLLILYMSTVTALAAFGAARYRISIEPLLIAGASVAITSWWRKTGGRKKRPDS